ncbi:MAG: hypothetical protein L6R45_29305 [Anaerolineae bacterium]|nr:hypothetical protein [Anaerolineae bacterium]
MIALPLRLTLQEPLLAAALAGDPNSATTYPFIPGSLIHGALARQYAEKYQVANLAADATARRLFYDGQSCFLNGYPVAVDGQRCLPTPLSWVIEKGTEPPTDLYDLCLPQSSSAPGQPRSLSKPFCHLVGQTVALYQPLRRFSVHTRRDRSMGRATEAGGAIFRYEALAPGQIFRAVILFDQPGDEQVIKDLLSSGSLLLGGSRSASYGRVLVEVERPPQGWREVPGSVGDIAPGQRFTLTLLSDLLVRDQNGQYTANLTEPTLAAELKVSSVKIINIYKTTGLSGGFNRKWGLPLPQTPVIRAGSVFVLQAGETVDAAAIANLEARGLGQRRSEGFGRAAINWHGQVGQLQLVGTPKAAAGQNGVASSTGPVMDTDSQTLANTMLARLLRQQVEGHLAERLSRFKLKPNGLKPSQPARLRVIIRTALTNPGQTGPVSPGLARVGQWLDDLKAPARKQFEAAQVDQTPLLDWIRLKLQHPAAVWPELQFEEAGQLMLPGLATDVKTDLAGEMTLRLIDGVLARLAKEAKNHE